MTSRNSAVERAQRLVHHEGLGLAHDRAAERDALAVAAGQAGHRAVEQMRDPQDARRLLDTRVGSRPRACPTLAADRRCSCARSCADRARRAGTRRRCRARDARLKVTSSPPSRMRPPVGSSSPAIMRSVVVLPQPEGPSRQKNSPSRDRERRVLARPSKVAERLAQILDADLGHARYSGNFETTMNITVPSSIARTTSRRAPARTAASA